MTRNQWAHAHLSAEHAKALQADPAAYWAGVELMDLLEEVLRG